MSSGGGLPTSYEKVQDMSQVMFVVVVAVLILLSVIGLATLVIVALLYKMHNVRNADGQFAWMVPSSYTELASKLTQSQELIVKQLTELSEQNRRVAELTQSSVNALLEMRQELNGLK